MSSYICAISAEASFDKLSTYFSRYGAQNYKIANLCSTDPFPDCMNGKIFFATNGVESCMDNNGSFFKGYAIHNDNRTITFNRKQTGINGQPTEGCYLSVVVQQETNGATISVSNDLFGLLPIFYTELNGIFVISDSLLALTDIRSHLGYTNSTDVDLFIAKSSALIFSDQLIDTRTGIVDIFYSLPGSKIDVLSRGKQVIPDVSHPGARTLFPPSSNSYRADIKKVALDMAGLLAGIASSQHFDLRLDITGGQDSRTVLAAAVAGCRDQANLSLQCATHATDDLRFAQDIAKFTELPINNVIRSRQLSVDPLALWFAASAGVYDAIYAPFFRPAEIEFLSAGGHGAEAIKGNYGWLSIDQMLETRTDIPKEVLSNLLRAARAGLESFGIDPNVPDASEWHYLAFRCAIHGGRFTNASYFSLRPLLNRTLIDPAHQRWLSPEPKSTKTPINFFSRLHERLVASNILPISSNRASSINGAVPQPIRQNNGKESAITDLLVHMNANLAALEFLDPAKNFTLQEIDTVLDLVGQIGEVTPYTVWGCPDAATTGPLDYLIQLAASKGFEGRFEHSTIIDLVSRSRDIAPRALHPCIDRLTSFVNDRTSDPFRGNSIGGRAAGKLLSLYLAD